MKDVYKRQSIVIATQYLPSMTKGSHKIAHPALLLKRSRASVVKEEPFYYDQSDTINKGKK